jgi:PKD repeat protein
VSNVPPIANFTYFPLDPTTADTIQFNDTSVDLDGTIISWSWDFGDGSSSSLQNTSHKYADDGVYTVTLNVTDDDGAFGTKSLSISVSNVPPVANFSYLPADPYTSDTIQFTDTSVDSDGVIISWLWSFGDGSTSIQQHASHKYSDDGEYIVILTVTDDDGAENTITKLIYVRNVPPVASFGFEPLTQKYKRQFFQ